MKWLVVAVLTVLLALTGCSGNSAASGPTSTPSSEPPAAAAAATARPSTSSNPVVSASECLSGRYRLIRFVGVGERGTYGTGEGGDVAVTFDNDSYRLRGAGKEPIKLTLAGQTADLLVDGTISGSHQIQGDRATFTIGQSSGSATFTVGKVKKSVPMAEVANVLAPDREAGVVCTNNALIVMLYDLRLEFGSL